MVKVNDSKKSKVFVVDYTSSQLTEKELENIEESFSIINRPTNTWLNVIGVRDRETIESLGKRIELHPLVIEDIINTHQRPKLEDFDKHLFLVLKIVHYDEDKREVKSEQVSLILGKHFVISFQEEECAVFDEIKVRIRRERGKIRKLGSDYLAYNLIDVIVDNYFTVLENMGEDIEELETELVENPSHDTLNKIHRLKQELITLRRSIWPLRDVMSSLHRLDSKLIKESTELYMSDVYDHILRVIDTLETYRDMVSGMLDVYLSSVSNRMNEIMKILTIISTFFIPLTFLVGLYGMNFEYMPELQSRWGYPLVWLVMITMSIMMFFYFRRKKWL